MRALSLSVFAWLGVIQAMGSDHASMLVSLDHTARIVGLASVLATLTIMIYRLGVWRQEMEHTKHDIGGEVKAHREESTANFDRVERRLEAIDQLLAMAVARQARTTRWQARADRRLQRLEDNAERVND